ncbi:MULTISPECIES: D-2-hydroxyacid dehydrogenase [unclassified Salinibacterium]|uniref:D-2-hydroxyacid dehydrogenase n=1 Tax=unclassified Salinibacterium TaxID=2632331 RepID=UPI0027DA816C|nr:MULTISPECIES: D-2-hydroxyacid dehydrogenase [unclassified Salinibacterium]
MGIAATRLTVGVATPLSEELCALIESLEPRVQLIRDQSLLPPMRFTADYAGDPDFRRTAQQQSQFMQLLNSADALYGIPDLSTPLLKEVVQQNDRLRWVQTMAAGGGAQIREAGFTRHELDRVAFTTSAGVHGGPLAEFALFGLLAASKSLPRLLRQSQAHEWSERWPMAQLSDHTILLLGLGGIGSALAEKLSALGVHVIGMSRRGEMVPGVAEIIEPHNLPAAIQRADGIVVSLPGTPHTEKLVDAEFFTMVKPGVTVVNVGRGSVIDEQALIAALEDGRVGFAALDVVETEPLVKSSPLWEMDNVLLSPHTAALSYAQEEQIARLFARNASAFLDGRPLRNVVDTVHFY